MLMVDTSNSFLYNLSMENNYIYTKNTISFIRYHFIFTSRYRRKIFLINEVEKRFTEILYKICEEKDINIEKLECSEEYVYLYITGLPQHSPADIMNWIKSKSSSILRREFIQLSSMPSLWTRNYYVSTADTISNEIIMKYVNSQKNKP